MVKKFTLLVMGAIFVMGTAMGGSTMAQKNGVNPLKGKVKAQQEHVAEFFKNHKVTSTRAMDAVTDIITNPVGEMKYYNKNTVGLYWFDEEELVDAPALMVFGDNNEVYIQDILTDWALGSFVKGEIKDDVISVSLPQTVGYYPSYDCYINAVLLKGEGEDYEVTDVDSVNFLYDAESGELLLDLPGEPYEYMLGYVYTLEGGIWDGDGDFYQEYSPMEGVNVAPADVTFEEYILKAGNFGYPVYVGIDSENIYIKGMSAAMPLSVVIAKLDGNKATISQNQILGGYYTYWIYSKVVEEKGDKLVLCPATQGYELNVDLEKKIISSANPDLYLCFNADLNEVYYLDLLQDFQILVQDTFAGTPANPYDLIYSDADYADYGMYGFIFELPAVSTVGDVLKYEDLYYRVYVDGDLFEFIPDDMDYIYIGLDGPSTEIPYMLDNWNDIQLLTNTMHYVGIYVDGVSTIGVQSVYNYNGEETLSDIVTLDIETGEVTNTPAGVDSLVSAPVVDSSYYDLNGRKINDPSKGIFIKRSTLSNGKVVTVKVIKR